MNSIKKVWFKKLTVYKRVFIVFVLVCLLTVGFSFQYYRNLHSAIREESKNYLMEVSSRIGSNLDRIINDNYSILYTVASFLEDFDVDTFESINSTLNRQKMYWDYKDVILIDENGRMYDLNNKETFLSIEASVLDDLVVNKKAMSTTQIINNHEFFVFGVPLDDVTIDGKRMMAIAGMYDPASLEQVLSMTSFDKKAYSQIISKNGSVITRATSDYAMKVGYNVFNSIENANFESGASLDKIKIDIKNNISGQTSFKYDGVDRYMVYTSINPDDWYLLTFVPVQAVNERSDSILRITLFMCGIITVAFSGLVTILTYIFNQHKHKLEDIAYIDDVTGGNTIKRFYDLALNSLNLLPDTQYVLIYSNIEKFKVLNEQIGRQNCDLILKYFTTCINSYLEEDECMGRLFADNFCILLKYENEDILMSRFSTWIESAEKYISQNQLTFSLPSIEFGIYVIENRNLTFHQMIDRAKLSLRESSRSLDGKLRYAFYDDEVRRQLFREKHLEDMMEKAILNNEFQVYLQPKYFVNNEKIGGAEALVRWESPSEGMIFPNEFIPLFESNGFIVRLDLWVFEEVCKTIRRWIDEGLKPIKISVNCSRVHLKDINFLNPYREISQKYKIPKNYIEIELTESVVLENIDLLKKVIDDIHESGFGCSMDDFGSGYSSLNLIQSISVDTLKLDKIFFKESVNSGRVEAVVGSIIKMAKALSMKTVAEGVEEYAQVEMLRRAGCEYIQGYVFAKPMKIKAFEELALNEMKIERGDLHAECSE